ncbi:ATP-binding protein [Candidatus Micrarchaeota archaeon]|nr:ATP-binding protein [Candidatus Micrarchaeota archaeon]MBU1887338.1 ATP-binding protein [Candidatus Micrarchaeota archaeon]
MVNEKVKRALREFNPFWKTPVEIEYKDREVYGKLRKFIKEPQIVSLCGLRRVGKTTILQKIIQDLLKENPTDSILYFSFDDFGDIELYEILDGFKEIHQKEPRFLIFDEIQKLPNWAEKVKIFYDTKKYKIFISGSESLFLRKGSRESLAGRIYEFEVKKLSFLEYLNFVGKGEMTKKPQLYDIELKIELSRYLLTGGFPELIGNNDKAMIRQYLKTAIIEKIVFKDMTKIYPIENPAQLIAILDILVDNPGMIVDFSSLSQELGISRQTLSKYFEYLEMAHLVVKLYNFSRNRITSEKSLKKFYPTFLSPVLIEESEERIGKLIETTCVLATDTKFFWRDKYKDEVDIILQQGKEVVPIEIKYRNKPSQNKGLPKFCKKYKCKEAIIVTKDKRGKNEDIRFIPVYEFLLGF